MCSTVMGRRAASAIAVTALLSVFLIPPPATASTVKFALPWGSGKSYQVTQGPGGGYSHSNNYNRTAVDFALPWGTPVLASQSGVIAFEGWNGLGGIEAFIDHGSDNCTQYSHLSRTIVDRGQRVLRGQVIGYSGGSRNGSQTGVAPHLHWAGVYCSTHKSRFIVNTVERGTSYPTGLRPISRNSGADVRNPNSGRCLDVPWGSSANGVGLQLYDCNRTIAQLLWNEPQSSGRIRILNGAKCIDIRGGVVASGTVVQTYQCNGTAAQKWTVRRDGTIRPRANSSLCLDAAGAGRANGTKVRLYSCNGTGAQRWY